MPNCSCCSRMCRSQVLHCGLRWEGVLLQQPASLQEYSSSKTVLPFYKWWELDSQLIFQQDRRCLYRCPLNSQLCQKNNFRTLVEFRFQGHIPPSKAERWSHLKDLLCCLWISGLWSVFLLKKGGCNILLRVLISSLLWLLLGQQTAGERCSCVVTKMAIID